MSRFAAGPVAIVSALFGAWPLPAMAADCMVDSSYGSLENCVENARAGDQILLPSSATIESGSILIDKNLTFRSSNPGEPAVWVHQTYEDFDEDLFVESAFPVEPLLTIEKGAIVDLADLEIVPMTYTLLDKAYTVARVISVVDGANATARNVSVDGVIGAYTGSSSGQPGGYVGYVSGGGSTLTFEDCTLRNIEADDHDGGVAYASESGTVRFTGSTLVEWSTAWSGAVAFAEREGAIETDANAGSQTPTFSDNSATVFGGAFSASSGEIGLTLEGGTFQRNHASYGGSISVINTGASVSGVRIESSSAAQGGAIFSGDGGAPVSIDNGSVLVGNTATESGGAVYAEGTPLTLQDCFFQLNDAAEPSGVGGAMLASGGTLTVTNCRFLGNTAAAGAGALQFESVGNTSAEGAVEVLGSVFIDNAGRQAGAISVFSSDPVDEVIHGNRFCGNEAGDDQGSGSVWLGGSGRPTVSFDSNLVDGTDSFGVAPSISFLGRDYEVNQNTFMRLNTTALLSEFSSGTFTRNVVTWIDADAPFTGYLAGDTPAELSENVWFDPDSRWTAAVEVAGEAVPLGSGSLMGDPRFTLGATGDTLPSGCDIETYTLRPDTSVLLDGAWDSANAPTEMAGFWGGDFGPARLWRQDGDEDGVAELWDCDDLPGRGEDIQEGMSEYRDVDGDGFAGELVSEYSCVIAAGNSATRDDCDEGDPAIHECDPDPDPEEEVFWYGSGCDASPGGGTSLLFIGLVPLLRRRRRNLA
ncbi:MAG: hypothetical protein AB8H79_06590 [Myxococcota bacterium]